MKINVFERYNDDKGEVVENTLEMWPVDAREAVRHDPKRYSTTPFASADAKGKPPQSHKVEKRSDGSWAVELHGKEIKGDLTKAAAEKLAAELDAA